MCLLGYRPAEQGNDSIYLYLGRCDQDFAQAERLQHDGLPESYWNNQNWNWLRISVRQLNISAQRLGLDAVPCTKTTGMSPGRYAVVATKGVAAAREVNRA